MKRQLSQERQVLTGIPTPADVLGLIEPIDPDTLLYLGGGMYQARWLSISSFGEQPPKDQALALISHSLIDYLSMTESSSIIQVLFKLKETDHQ